MPANNVIAEALDRFIEAISERVNLPDEVVDIFTAERVKIIDAMLRDYGGERSYIPKQGRSDPIKEAAVKKDYLNNLPEQEITSRHGISRATLYRYLKK